MKSIVTPELKDKVLSALVEHCTLSCLTLINRDSLAQDLNTTREMIDGILNQFIRMGLCTTSYNSLGCDIGIVLYVEAHDMVRRGGFVAKEKILEDNLEKLALEIEELRMQDTAHAARITAILANISGFFNFVMKSQL